MKERTGLDPAVIVERALAIADREGLAALSMRRLAGALDVTPMALYHHVASKDELLDLMADMALQALPDVDLETPWDAEVERFFMAYYRLLIAHPALAEVTTRRPLNGPTAARLGDRVLQLLVDAGYDGDEAVALFIALFNYMVGASAYRHTRHGRHQPRLSKQLTPTAYRLRARLARAGDDAHFSHGLRRLIASFQPVA